MGELQNALDDYLYALESLGDRSDEERESADDSKFKWAEEKRKILVKSVSDAEYRIQHLEEKEWARTEYPT